MTTLAIKIGCPIKSFLYLISKSDLVQKAVLKGEIATYEEKSDLYNAVVRCYQSNTPLKVNGVNIVINQERLRVQVGLYQEFLKHFNSHSLSIKLLKREQILWERSLEAEGNEKDTELSEIRRKLLSINDKKIGLKKDTGDLSYRPEHVKLLSEI